MSEVRQGDGFFEGEGEGEGDVGHYLDSSCATRAISS